MAQVSAASSVPLQEFTDPAGDDDLTAHLHNRLAHTQRLAGIGSLTSGVADELGRLLSIVTAACLNLQASLPAESSADNSITHYLALIEENAFRSAHLAQVLHNCGSSGEVRPAVSDVQVILNDALTLVQHQFQQEAGVQITAVPPQPPRSIICDHGAIVQLLVNLLSNARDALDPDGGVIELGCHALPTSPEQIVFTVKDHGPGIPSGLEEQIFAPFFSTKGGSKVGLGLTIAQAIAQQHHGRVTAHNNRGPASGATFIVTLPVRPPDF
jgi:signal transduction histidine kinase